MIVPGDMFTAVHDVFFQNARACCSVMGWDDVIEVKEHALLVCIGALKTCSSCRGTQRNYGVVYFLVDTGELVQVHTIAGGNECVSSNGNFIMGIRKLVERNDIACVRTLRDLG